MRILGIEVKLAIRRVPSYAQAEWERACGELVGMNKRLNIMETTINRMERKIYRKTGTIDQATDTEIDAILQQGAREREGVFNYES
ncbi:hypothetical protein ES703_79381 [subsurface metagenome]